MRPSLQKVAIPPAADRPSKRRSARPRLRPRRVFVVGLRRQWGLGTTNRRGRQGRAPGRWAQPEPGAWGPADQATGKAGANRTPSASGSCERPCGAGDVPGRGRGLEGGRGLWREWDLPGFGGPGWVKSVIRNGGGLFRGGDKTCGRDQ
ncbi:hypothetical protein P7K49_033170 [Saguinus oedipus]|uniref:Uncharacterized protein n=1 Tax=Saguinus oedipus TaxID=9490 RepID=A0ABQ9TS83_SAGOE|nr:hypothetical protein P7K49_033170 [Saguinus oedipus]